jgi:hypothetical protein
MSGPITSGQARIVKSRRALQGGLKGDFPGEARACACGEKTPSDVRIGFQLGRALI